MALCVNKPTHIKHILKDLITKSVVFHFVELQSYQEIPTNRDSETAALFQNLFPVFSDSILDQSMFGSKLLV